MAALREDTVMRKYLRKTGLILLIMASLLMSGCNGNVGVGLSVGVPVGNHGYMSVGTGRWY